MIFACSLGCQNSSVMLIAPVVMIISVLKGEPHWRPKNFYLGERKHQVAMAQSCKGIKILKRGPRYLILRSSALDFSSSLATDTSTFLLTNLAI